MANLENQFPQGDAGSNPAPSVTFTNINISGWFMVKKKHGFWESFYVDNNKGHPIQQKILNYYVLAGVIALIIWILIAFLR